MAAKKSIFDLNDQFGMQSPFDNWLAEREQVWEEERNERKNRLLNKNKGQSQQIDPDAPDSGLCIVYWVNKEAKYYYYNYVIDRKEWPDGATDNLKNTVMALDYLYAENAMYVKVGQNENPENNPTINVLKTLIEDKKEENLITIRFWSSKIERNEFDPNEKMVYFNPTVGIVFSIQKDVFVDEYKNYDEEVQQGCGRNSAASLLAHELYHAYNCNHDSDNYGTRKDDKKTQNEKLDPPFSNAEEKYVTLILQNQTNVLLCEAERVNYGREYYHTKDPTTTAPMKKK